MHGFAGPLGGLLGAPHRALCGLFLPHVMAANVHSLEARDPNSPAVDRYREVARILTGIATACPDDGIKWVRDLCAVSEVPPLSSHGLLGEKDLPAVVAKVRRASSAMGNPVSLSREEIYRILQKAIGW